MIFRSFLFFFMLINLALSSICAGVQTFVAFILDEKPEWTKWVKIVKITINHFSCCFDILILFKVLNLFDTFIVDEKPKWTIESLCHFWAVCLYSILLFRGRWKDVSCMLCCPSLTISFPSRKEYTKYNMNLWMKKFTQSLGQKSWSIHDHHDHHHPHWNSFF